MHVAVTFMNACADRDLPFTQSNNSLSNFVGKVFIGGLGLLALAANQLCKIEEAVHDCICCVGRKVGRYGTVEENVLGTDA